VHRDGSHDAATQKRGYGEGAGANGAVAKVAFIVTDFHRRLSRFEFHFARFANVTWVS
jgi:uncharacterized spore protein YtfJ